MKTFLSLLAFISLFSNNDIAQQQNFFPLAIGNEYQFNNGNSYWFGNIDRDTVYTNGRHYFTVPYFMEFGDCRLDSNGNMYSATKPFFINGEPEEYLLFKVDAMVDETWPVAWNFDLVIDTGYAKCIYDDTLLVFGDRRRVKGTLIFDESYQYYYFWLAEGIGLIRNQYDDGSSLDLNYAYLSGISYGLLVPVEVEYNPITSDLFVSQNFPNPFNGETQIEVRISAFIDEKFKILIFNILGSLVYEEEFTSKDPTFIKINTNELNLSTGTYFYTIRTANKHVTKKFLLLK